MASTAAKEKSRSMTHGVDELNLRPKKNMARQAGRSPSARAEQALWLTSVLSAGNSECGELAGCAQCAVPFRLGTREKKHLPLWTICWPCLRVTIISCC